MYVHERYYATFDSVNLAMLGDVASTSHLEHSVMARPLSGLHVRVHIVMTSCI